MQCLLRHWWPSKSITTPYVFGLLTKVNINRSLEKESKWELDNSILEIKLETDPTALKLLNNKNK